MATAAEPEEREDMPGIHFYFDPCGNLDRKEDLLLHSARSLLHEKWFILKTLVSRRGCFLAATYHPRYPVAIYENNEFFICLEGTIYGESAAGVDAKLGELAGILFGPPPRPLDRARDWLLATDGDFVIFIQHRKTGSICVVNDALGRLPLYYRHESGRLALSRESRFITNLDNSVEFDRLAIAQYLLLGFMPGDKTFFEGVSRLEPATLISIDPEGRADPQSNDRSRGGAAAGGASRVGFHRLFTFDFSSRRGREMDAAACASRLADIFRKACLDRAGGDGVNVVSLSGGPDSRAVASALASGKAQFQGATFLGNSGDDMADAKTAETVAGILEVPWRLFKYGPARGSDAMRLLRMKNGGDHLGMSFSMGLFDMIREAWGDRVTFFTGAGGSLVVPDNRPAGRFAGTDELAGHLISRNAILTLPQAAAVTGLRADRIRESIGDYLASCPEHKMSDKYLHFMVCGRDMKRAAEGEDRNRFFFWTVAPFNSLMVIDHAMNCPDGVKSKHRLYREFLSLLSPKAAAIDIVGGMTTDRDGKRFPGLRAGVPGLAPPETLRKFFVKRGKTASGSLGGRDSRSAVIRCFMEQFEGCEAVPEYLSQESVASILPSIGARAFDHLFTVSSLIEDITCGESTIERYEGIDLI
jgi:asparagine synthase (glutamine-hydrolysing)